MSEGAPKSALEIALERLKKQDEAAGTAERTLSAEQKAAIGEARNFYEAKVAELKILHASKVRLLVEPEARALLEEEYRRDLERLASDRDAKIERVRRGE
jgi:hypothetical protein